MENDKDKIAHLYQLIEGAETSIRAAKELLAELSGRPTFGNKLAGKAKSLSVSSEGKVIEGVFDGEHMLGPDKKKYPVPANYASKSKLVQGDVLKLTVNNDGSFLFKQIGPVERKKVVGNLTYANGDYRVIAEGKAYKVLFASITYYKAQPGDAVTLVVPTDSHGEWGAIENVIDLGEGESAKASQPEFEPVENETGELFGSTGDEPERGEAEILKTPESNADISALFSGGENEYQEPEEPKIQIADGGGAGENDFTDLSFGDQPQAEDSSPKPAVSGNDLVMDQEIRELEI